MILEYVTLGLYFTLLLSLGAVFARFNKNLSDFVRGGARGTWWMVGTSITMTGISAFTFTGGGSAAFEAGPSLLAIYIANAAGLLAGALFLARWYRQTRAITGPDVIRQRFGTPAEQIVIYAGLLNGPMLAAIQLWALGVFVSAVFGLPLTSVIVVVGLIVVFYSVSGGMWAVMATDMVQGIILFSITIIVTVLALVEIGGIAGFIDHITRPENREMMSFVKEEGAFPMSKFTWHWALVIFSMQFFGQIQLGNSGRYLTTKDGREASRAAWLAFALMSFGSVIWFIPPIIAKFLYAGEVHAIGLSDPGAAAYSVIAMKVLPQGLLGIMIAAMFAATMSSMDTGITQQTGIIVNNLIGRIREAMKLPALSDRTMLRLCRGISLALGSLIISVALILAKQDDITLFDILLLMSSIIGLPLFLPQIAGLFLRRLPAWSFFVIAITAALPSLYSVIGEQMGLVEPWAIQIRAAWIFAFGATATAICLAFTRYTSARDRMRQEQFYATMFAPVDFEKEIGQANDSAQARLIGRVVLAIATILLLLLFLPNPLSGRLVILTLCAMIGKVGAIMLYGSRVEARKSRETAITKVAVSESQDTGSRTL